MGNIFLDLLGIRAESWAELIERARHARNTMLDGGEAVRDHVDPFERVADERFDPMSHLEGFVVVDRRDVPNEDRRKRGRSQGLRAVSNVKALCVHQTATNALGPDHPRLLGLPAHAHVGERKDGTVVVTLLHPVTAYLYHGHGWNRDTIGIEVQARAAGAVGKRRTFWRSSKEKATGKSYEELVREPSAGKLAAVRALTKYYAALMAQRKSPLVAVVTHRQSARKPSDPGEAIARVAFEAGRQLGFEDWALKTRGKGRPAPDSWTGLANGVKY